MDKVVAVVFDDEKQAYQGLRAFRDLHREGSITLYSAAVVAKDASGTVSVREAGEGPAGTFFGLLTGSLVGLLGGPVGLAVGAGTGTLIGAAFDLTRAGIAGDFLEDVSEYLLPGKAAVFTELDEEWQAPIDTRMEALGGHVFRRNRIAVEDAYYERQIAMYREELAALEAEREKASAERKARLEARIEDTRHKLQDKRDELKARIESIKREGDAKIASLQQQLTSARDERKQRLEKRLAELRTEPPRAVGQAPSSVGADEIGAPLRREVLAPCTAAKRRAGAGRPSSVTRPRSAVSEQRRNSAAGRGAIGSPNVRQIC